MPGERYGIGSARETPSGNRGLAAGVSGEQARKGLGSATRAKTGNGAR